MITQETKADAVRWATRISRRPGGYDSEYKAAAEYVLATDNPDSAVKAAAEALVKLDEESLQGNIPYKDRMDTEDTVALGIKLAYFVLGREMPLGDLI